MWLYRQKRTLHSKLDDLTKHGIESSAITRDKAKERCRHVRHVGGSRPARPRRYGSAVVRIGHFCSIKKGVHRLDTMNAFSIITISPCPCSTHISILNFTADMSQASTRSFFHVQINVFSAFAAILLARHTMAALGLVDSTGVQIMRIRNE